jgi:hypothetical protein
VRARVETAFERADNGRRYTGRMPVHAHNGAEGLEPERIAEPRKELRCAVVEHDALADRRSELRHAIGKPCRDTSAVQGEIGVSGAFHGVCYEGGAAVLRDNSLGRQAASAQCSGTLPLLGARVIGGGDVRCSIMIQRTSPERHTPVECEC